MGRKPNKARQSNQGRFDGKRLQAELAQDSETAKAELVRAGHSCKQPLLCHLAAATCKAVNGPKEEPLRTRTPSHSCDLPGWECEILHGIYW